MPWWGWVTVGALLLVAEASVVDLQFYLVFLGLAALLTGIAMLGGLGLPIWGQWLLFAGLSGASFVFFRRALYQRIRPPLEDQIDEGVEGACAIASEDIAPGTRGVVTLRGATWTAHNVGPTPIRNGDACLVERSEGLVVQIRATD